MKWDACISVIDGNVIKEDAKSKNDSGLSELNDSQLSNLSNSVTQDEKSRIEEVEDSNEDQYGVLKKLCVQKNEAYILGTHRTGIIINEKVWDWDDTNKVCWFVQGGSLAGSKLRRQPWNEIQDKWKDLRRL